MKSFVFLFLILISSCTPVAKLICGFRKPKQEDKESLTHYLNKKRIKADNILVFADSLSFYKRLRAVKDLPQVRVFNREGMLVYFKDSTESCNGPAYDFTKTICLFSNSKLSSSKTLSSETKNLLTIDRLPAAISSGNDVDYFVFIYWARFEGRFNKNHVRVWENNLTNVHGCKVSVYKIDMDWQKAWYKK